MPSIVTHHLFAKDVYRSFERKVSYPHFLIFAQSFDNLFYYQFLTPWTGSDIRQLGNIGQHQKVNNFFENIISFIDNNNLQNNQEVMAFLYGCLCHYILDSTCHPYVFYYTKSPAIDKSYRGHHEKMEVNLDAYMLWKKEKKILRKENMADSLLPKIKFSESLYQLINYVFSKTFAVDFMGEKYHSSVNTGNFLIKYFVTDKTGLKKQLYKIKDFLCFWSGRRYEFLSFYVTKIFSEYLNDEHEIWCNPWNNEITSTQSFEELYEEALQKMLDLILDLEKYWNKQITKDELLEIIGDNSYASGLPWRISKEMKYFKNF